MLLKDHLPEQGNWLFRWRSYLPLGLLPFALIALWDSRDLVPRMGETLAAVCVAVGLAISLLGIAVRVLTVGFVPAGTSGKNARAQRAETLNTTGIYATVRNPLYLGNFLMLIGVVVALKVWWFVLLTMMGFALYYERIILAEERFLESKFGAVYCDWAAVTPAFFPRPSQWSSPSLTFSARTVLKREGHGLYLIVFLFTALSLVDHVVVETRPLNAWVEEDIGWVAFFLIGTLAFVVLRGLKKHTKLLRVEGR